MTADPHATQAIFEAGAPLNHAAGAVILLHGRGGSAAEILHLGSAIAPAHWALLAPQAAGHSWYPLSFLAARNENEPYLSSALGRVLATVDHAVRADIPAERIAIVGFSQGACLATEFVGRNPRRYAGLVAFTGGLIGPPTDIPGLSGDLAGTAALLSSGDPDPHVPWKRVEESARLLEGIGARVTLRRFPGRPHTVSREETELARELLASV